MNKRVKNTHCDCLTPCPDVRCRLFGINLNDHEDNTPDPEEKHWRDMATNAERFSDPGEDY